MSARRLSILSVALSVVLLAGLWRVSVPAGPEPAPRMASSTHPGATVRGKTNVTRVEVTLTNDLPPFHWEQVQSEDLTNYVANLRGIGCPEETIRDILRGELTAQYLARRRVLLEPWQRQYWDLAVRGLGQAQEQFGKELEKLQAETIDRLDELVGSVKPPPEPPSTRRDSRIDFLSEDKQRQMAAVDKHFNGLERALPRDPRDKGPMTPERRAKLKELKDQRLEAVRALMSPEEFEEYRLRTSRYANVGRGLEGFEASENELRALTRTYEQFSAADESPDRKAADYEARRQQQKELQRQREESLKAQFGEERYAELKRTQDGNFREIFQVTERYGLPRSAAVTADDLRRVAQENMDRVRSFHAPGSEQHLELIGAIQAETRAALIQALGEQAARTYERNGGAWLRQQGR